MLLMEMMVFITINKMLLSLSNRNQFFTGGGESESANTTIAVWSQRPFLRPRRSWMSLLKTRTPRGRCRGWSQRSRWVRRRRRRRRRRADSSLEGTSIAWPPRTLSGVGPIRRGSLKMKTTMKSQMMLMVRFTERLLLVVSWF